MKVRRRLAVVLLAVVAGCASGASPAAKGSGARTAQAAPTTSSSTTTTPLPVATAPSCPATPARAVPDPARPRYTLRADVRPDEGAVDGDLRVAFTPDVDTDRLVFRLWPNGPRTSAGTKLDAGPVSVGGREVPSSLDDATTLVVRPGGTLAAGRSLDVSLPWHLKVPGPADDRFSLDRDAMRLGSFFPILPWEPGVGWATDPAVGGFAEASTAPTADFDLTVTTPGGYDVLASGVADTARPGHFTATAMRDVALSVGHFTVATAVAMAPQPVLVTVGAHLDVDRVSDYLARAVATLQDFGKRYGPYPWPTYTLAITPGLGGGIEYPSFVMQGPRTLLQVTSHEIGHQWFYGLVGNDQGRDPWLDEGLASWAEARFEGTLARFLARPIPVGAKNMVGQPMTYWSVRDDIYPDGVYVQGVQALAALGDPDLVDCALRVYVAVNAYRIARPADFLRSASAAFPTAAATLAGFGVKA